MSVLGHAEAPGPAAWFTDPSILAVVLGAAVYLVGRARVRRRRSTSPLATGARLAWFLSGVAALLVVLCPPFDQLADDLFSAHMVQHLVLGLLAPLAFVASRPVPALTRGVPGDAGRRLRHLAAPAARRLERSSVLLALVLVSAHVGAFAVWHVPSAYDLALEHPIVHLFEHVTLFATGLGLWWVVMSVRWQNRSGLAALYLFVVGLPMGALGALLTLAPSPLYHAHLETAGEWGLTALQDQQLAGGIMWVPGGIIYLAAASVLFIRWLGAGPAPGEEVIRWGA